MKKWIIALGVSYLFIVTSCSQPTPTPIDEQVSPDTAQDVFNRAINQEETIDRKAFTMHLEQTRGVPKEEQVTVKSELSGEIIEDPFQMHAEGTISLIGLPTIGDFELETELYVAGKAIYVYENMFNNWIRGSRDQLNNLGIQLDEIPLVFQLKPIEPYIDNFIVEQTKATFVFKLEEMTESLQQDFLGQTLSIESNTEEIEQLDYSFTIDQETYNIKSLEIAWKSKTHEGDEPSNINTSLKIDFFKHNEVETNQVPQEVIDQAIDANQFGF